MEARELAAGGLVQLAWEASQLSMRKLELLPLAVNQKDQPQESAWGDHQGENQDSCILFLHCHAS